MDMKGILRSVKKRDFITYVIYLIESSISKVMADPKKYKPTPDAIVQTTVIFDMEGMSIQHVTNRKGNVAYLYRGL
jgi:metal transporter CNNM